MRYGDPTTGMLFLFRENDLKESRATVVVSKKFHGQAVKRNLLERRIRAVLSEYIDRIHPKHDIIVSCTKPGKMLSYGDVKSSVKSALSKYYLI